MANNWRERLQNLSTLKDGWRDRQSSAPTPKAIFSTGIVLMELENDKIDFYLYPLDDGGILIEFIFNEWDFSVEIHPNGDINGYKSNTNYFDPTTDEYESDLFSLEDRYLFYLNMGLA